MAIKASFKSNLKNVSLIKSKVVRWLNEPKWLNRLALYIILCAVVIIGSHIVFSYFGLQHTDVDSARYMLSALIQSEAAIIAVVVSLSLVVVQLAASSYSIRMIDVFKNKNPDFRILLGIYITAIIYGLLVLKLIEKASPNNLSSLEIHISGAYYFGIFAFLFLIPYIGNTLNLLKPTTVINILAEGITKPNILAAIREEQEDPIQPIIDIVRGSLMKYDYETTRAGLRAIGQRANHIFKNKNFEEKEVEKISEHIFTHLTRIGRLAASRGDEDSTREVVINLQKIGEVAARYELENVTLTVTESIKVVGITAARQKLEEATWWAAKSLGEVGKVAVEHKLENAITWIVELLEDFGKVAAEQKLEKATWWAAVSISWVGKATVKHKLEEEAMYISEVLKQLGEVAAEYKLEDATTSVAESLGVLGIASLEHELENVTEKVVEFLPWIRVAAATNKLENARRRAEESLGEINEALRIYKLEKISG